MAKKTAKKPIKKPVKKTTAKKALTEADIEAIPKLSDEDLYLKIGNRKYEVFAHHLVRMNNQAHAAIAAGYEEANARNTGCVIMKNPYVKELVRRKQADIAKELGLSDLSLLERLKNIATTSVYDFNKDWETRKDWADIKRSKFDGVQEIKTTTKKYIDENGEEVITTDTNIKLIDPVRSTDMLREALGFKNRTVEDDEEQKGAQIDVSQCTSEELAVLAKFLLT